MMKILVISTYGIYDPPVRNLLIQLNSRGYCVHWIDYIASEKKSNRKHGIINYGLLKTLFGRKLAFHVIKNLCYFKFKPKIIFLFGYESEFLNVFRCDKVVLTLYDVCDYDSNSIFRKLMLMNLTRRMKRYKSVLSSDQLKANLINDEHGYLPKVFPNVPSINYWNDVSLTDDDLSVLRIIDSKLQSGKVVFTRAGGIGDDDFCSETLSFISEYDLDWVFVVMGKLEEHYLNKLTVLVDQLNLGRRVMFVNRPSDELWKEILLRTTVGHSLQGFHSKIDEREIFKNNSILSNNRIYQFLSAGIPFLYTDIRLQYNEDFDKLGKYIKTSDLFSASMIEIVRKASLERLDNLFVAEHVFKFRSKYNYEKYFNELIQPLL